MKRSCRIIGMVAAMVWMAGVAMVWGQDYVTGDKYYKWLNTSIVDISANESPADTNSEVEHIYDGNTDTWCKFPNQKTIELTITFDTPQEVTEIDILGGGNKDHAYPSKVEVQYSSNKTDWISGSSYEFSKPASAPHIMQLQKLNIPETKYLKLILTPHEGNDNFITVQELGVFPVVKTIKHKATQNKWYDIRGDISGRLNLDTFSDDEPTFTTEDGRTIQATHTYIDTIYVNPGTKTRLRLPDMMSPNDPQNGITSKSYQRWYSYRTGKTFEIPAKNRTNDVYDLLTPATDRPAYRYANGYVGNPIAGINQPFTEADFYFPTEEEFNQWFAEVSASVDNSWYVVACDVSIYNDFGDKYQFGGTSFDPKNPHEPTLSHRIIYYICSAEKPGHLEQEINWYRKAINNPDYYKENGKFLEEYDIEFPMIRVSNNTFDMVALSKDARSYAIPGDEGDSNLTIKLIDGEGNKESGITLVTTNLNNNGLQTGFEDKGTSNTISGLTRAIQFRYPTSNKNTDGTLQVNNPNAEATILVTKKVGEKTYNIAKYNLLFKPETRLLTQSQVSQLSSTEELYKRSSKYLEDNYELLTKLDFDYDESIAEKYGQSDYYPFPMAWDHSSYGFFDGAKREDVSVSRTTPATEWGYYSIQKHYTEVGDWGDAKPSGGSKALPGSTYHLYVDASDRPGVIARLPFEENLCAGSELFVTAWVKNCIWQESKNAEPADGGMMLSIMGVTKTEQNGQTVEIYTPLYRHNTGQIRQTNLLTSENGVDSRKVTVVCESDVNEWYQVYFSFITEDELPYDSYVLQIDNSSLSTNGGDMYLDDVRIYFAKPEAELKQLEAKCLSDDERPRLNFSINWERLLSRAGNPDIDNGETSSKDFPTDKYGNEYSAIGICFLDKEIYEETHDIKKAAVQIGSGIPGEGGQTNDYQFAAMFYHLSYKSHNNYDEYDATGDRLDGSLAMHNDWFFYKSTTSVERALTVDFFAKIKPYRTYIMVVATVDPENENETAEQIRQRLAEHPDDFFHVDEACAIKKEISINAQDLVMVDGSVINPETQYCEGQILNFSIQLRAPQEDGSLTDVKDQVYFDWFFGTEEEFTEERAEYGCSLEDALRVLRNKDKSIANVEGMEIDNDFTQGMKDLIDKLSSTASGGLNSSLVLHQANLTVMLTKSESDDKLNLVVRPIPIKLDGGETVCWDYIPLELEISGESPRVHIGFYELEGKYLSEPNIRIGRAQIAGAEDEDSALKIDLQGIQLVDEKSELSMHIDNGYVYLVGSNDPDLEFEENFDVLSLPVGILHEFKASTNDRKNNCMRISFDLEGVLTGLEENDFKFNPKEGYEYYLRVYFQEAHLTENDNIGETEMVSLCDGILTFTMKVVPKYQRWIGGPTSNWNKDENWVRASNAELNNRDDYVDYSEKAPGYVPMDFTNVIIPKPDGVVSGKIHLYGEKNKATGHEPISLVATDHYVDEEPTTNIQYDLLVKKADGNGYECEPYYTNTVNQIHFEPGARILHAEKLDYNKAWVDYQLTRGQWYTLASPLKEIYAGDFYTGEEGKETVPYFSDITFDGHSRIKPPVYQRSWTGDAKLITLDGSNLPENVAINGNWSSVYNDVTVSYSVASGFSLKVPGNNSETVTFRLPKKDTEYAYFEYKGNTVVEQSDKYKVSKETTTDGRNLNTGDISVTPVEKKVGDVTYYLVGNPYMTDLNLTLFLAANQHLLPKYWVVTEGTQQSVVGEVSNISDADGIATIPPLQSFFVTPDEEKQTSGDIEIKFTPSMQTMEGYESQGGENGTNTDMLFLTVETSNGRQSHASIAYDPAASEGYKASEDAELFLDSNLGDLPMVYTAAGTMAASINRTSGLYNIPVGVYAPGAKGETVSLTFSGVDGFSYATLYDAETRTESPIHEGSRFTVPANTAGRYFLRAGVPTANEAVQESAIRIYTVGGGTLVVASTDLLRTVRVYDFAGRLVANETGLRTTQCRIELPEGSYIVKAESERGEEEEKIRM